MTYFDFWDFDNAFKSISNNTLPKTRVDGSLKKSPVYINAAGFVSSDLKAEIVQNDVLHITGETEKYGKKRIDVAIFVPDNVDQKTIELKVENGMIAVNFEHKREESKTIKVK